MIRANVKGGTNAGRRRVKRLASWTCRCVLGRTTRYYREHPGDRYSCPDCGTRRPTTRKG